MMSNEEKSLQEVLAPVMRVLRDLDGQLVFRDEDGVEFVLMGREYLERLRSKTKAAESQLSFEAMAARKEEAEENVVEADEAQAVAMAEVAAAASYDDLALIDESEYPEEAVDEREPDLARELDTGSDEEEEDGELVFTSNRNQPSPPPVRVRFEPLSGDLPPQLQE